MKIIDELVIMIENLNEEGQDYHDIRTIKRMVHNLAKIAENLEAAK